jgi:hypothetical protein
MEYSNIPETLGNPLPKPRNTDGYTTEQSFIKELIEYPIYRAKTRLPRARNPDGHTSLQPLIAPSKTQLHIMKILTCDYYKTTKWSKSHQ